MTSADFAKQFLPELTVDVVLLGVDARGGLQTLLVRRAEGPFEGAYALPGVFVGRDEPLDAAAARALESKAGLRKVFLEQLFTFGRVDRDPRGRIVSVAYYALVPAWRFETALSRVSGSVVAHVVLPPNGGTTLLGAGGESIAPAFDHAEIVATAVRRIRGKLDYAPIGFELLPSVFTLSDLQRIHEAVLERKLNKDSFRRKILASGLVEDTKERRTDTAFRPAALYRFKKEHENG